MAKEVKAQVKLQIPAGKANPAPPVGPSLGQHGVNIMEFCKQFNDKTQGAEDSHHSGDHHRSHRPEFHLHYEDTASFGFVEEGRGHHQRIGHPE